eukprot:TRINITY_DN7480_c0_g1_i2.p1 TRINITY_DN7480_c0_g1~~TRINITY_DN7480_c0_g1_i2.p1  ORF type:complete len:330 (+),score=31.90 TRINITY_DN7480_c0_g1_i2:24-992(+)
MSSRRSSRSDSGYKKRDRSRSRDRHDRDRDRRRSRSRDRHDRHDRRSRSRDRSDRNDRNDRSDRNRDRSRDRQDRRSRSRERRSDRSRSRDRNRRESTNRRSRSTERKKETQKRRSKSPSPSMVELHFTASQVVNRLCEVYDCKGKMRMEWISQVFSPDVVVDSLPPSEVILKGSDNVNKSYEKTIANKKSEPLKRVLIECENSTKNDATYALDFYDKLCSPGIAPKSIADQPTDSIVLYRVEKNVITHIWSTSDDEKLILRSGLTKDDFITSKLWKNTLDIVRKDLKNKLSCHLNDYTSNVDGLGLGLGTESRVEKWIENL